MFAVLARLCGGYLFSTSQSREAGKGVFAFWGLSGIGGSSPGLNPVKPGRACSPGAGGDGGGGTGGESQSREAGKGVFATARRAVGLLRLLVSIP